MSRFPASNADQVLCKKHQRMALIAEKSNWMKQREEALRKEKVEGSNNQRFPDDKKHHPESPKAAQVIRTKSNMKSRRHNLQQKPAPKARRSKSNWKSSAVESKSPVDENHMTEINELLSDVGIDIKYDIL